MYFSVIFITLAGLNHIMAMERTINMKEGKKKIVHISVESSMAIVPQVTHCLEETKVNLAALSELRPGGKGPTKNVDDFIACAFINSGYSDIKGNVDIPKFMNLVPHMKEKGVVQRVVRECDEYLAKNPAEKLRMFLVCYMMRSPVLLTL